LRQNVTNNSGDITRLWSLILNCKQIVAEHIAGDFAELGGWRDNVAAVLAYFAQRDDRQLWLFDTFDGFHADDLRGVDAGQPAHAFGDTSLALARSSIEQYSNSCHFVQGRFPDSITEEHRKLTYALVSLDCDLYEPMRAGLEFFYLRMAPGGMFLLHDYSSQFWKGAKLAVDEFCRAHGEFIVLMPDKSGSAFFRKSR
jgi:hypothetical protein